MHFGHEDVAGKVTVPQPLHRLPASSGGSSDAKSVASTGVGSSGTRSSSSGSPAASAGEQEVRTRQQAGGGAEELGGGSAVDRPVVEGEAQREHRGAVRHVALPSDAVPDPSDAEDAGVAGVDDRGEEVDAVGAQGGDDERRALEIGQREPSLPGSGGQREGLLADVDQPAPVGVPDDRDDEPVGDR